MDGDPFERGATYRSRIAFDALRDSFDPGERLVFHHHAVSIYDGMEGWFFYVDGAVGKERLAWDHELGSMPNPPPFERISDVHPLVRAAERGDVVGARGLAAGRAIDDAYVRVAMELAVEGGRADVVATLAQGRALSPASLARALQAAASGAQVEVALELLEAGVPPADEVLWSAVWSGATPIVEMLIARGADPRRAGHSVESMLEYSARRGHPQIAEILERYR